MTTPSLLSRGSQIDGYFIDRNGFGRATRHTANESLMMVSGKGKAEMKSGGAHPMTAGDYVYLPAKMGHQFTCISSCVLFDVIDGAFDIHYINAEGNEIPVEQALKTTAKPAAGKKP